MWPYYVFMNICEFLILSCKSIVTYYVLCSRHPEATIIGTTPGDDCRCQNRRSSARGSRTVCQGRMVTGDKGHDVFTQVRACSIEVIPYSYLINIDDMRSTRVD